MPRKCPSSALLMICIIDDNLGMNQINELLERLEIPAEASERAIKECAGDEDKITQYLLACLARYDDSHEYVV